jgi:Protein of unknown function DUF262
VVLKKKTTALRLVLFANFSWFMEYQLTTWPIRKLIKEYEAKHINLNPPYQRNPIWNLKAQQKLIDSVLTNKPIPNFFLHKKGPGEFDIIDGQQRVRSILAYSNNLLADEHNQTFQDRIDASSNRQQARSQFLDYPLTVTIVTKLGDNESVEDYYALLNKSGLRLNRPELKKADYFTTNFLKLLQELVEEERLKNLKLFTPSNVARMNDLDFVSELVATLKFGISDKKEKVDQLYEDDISISEMKALKHAFENNLETFDRFNYITPIFRTRYKQKNDFYTLFHLFYTIRNNSTHVLDQLYSILVKIGPHIRPSQEECEPLREYAFHCVTQSNSKTARQARHDILAGILLNSDSKPNAIQEAILTYFDISKKPLTKIGDFWTIDAGAIRDPHNYELEFVGDEVQS